MFGLHPTIRFERLRALIIFTGQVTTSPIDWHPNFYAGAAENASGGTGFDMLTGFFATVL